MIVSCEECHRCFREDEAAKVASAEMWDDDGAQRIQARWGHLPYIREPKEREYYAALVRGDFPTTPEVQREVRVLAWWARNFPARQLHDPARPRLDAASLSHEARHNLEELLTLLSADDEREQLLQAEVYRELGRFAEAREALQALQSDTTAPTVRILIDLCDAGDSEVKELSSSGWLSKLGRYGEDEATPRGPETSMP